MSTRMSEIIISNLLNEISRRTKETELLKVERDKNKSDCDRYKSDCTYFRSECDELRSKYNDKMLVNVQLQRKVTQLEKELHDATIRSPYDDELNTNIINISELKKELRECKTASLVNLARNQELDDTNTMLKTDLNMKSQDIERKYKECEDKDRLIESLTESNQEKQQKLDLRNQINHDQQLELHETKTKLDVKTKVQESIRAQLVVKDLVIKSQRIELETERNEKNQSNLKLQELNTQLVLHRDEINQLTIEKGTLTLRLTDCQADITHKTEELDYLRLELDKYRTELDQHVEQLNGSKDRVKRLESTMVEMMLQKTDPDSSQVVKIKPELVDIADDAKSDCGHLLGRTSTKLKRSIVDYEESDVPASQFKFNRRFHNYHA